MTKIKKSRKNNTLNYIRNHFNTPRPFLPGIILIVLLNLFTFNIFAAETSASPASTPRRQVIILKADDVIFTQRCQRFTDYIERKNITASLGVVAKTLSEDSLCSWLKKLASKGNFEIWNHGLVHECFEREGSEFQGNSYEDQLIYIKESQRIFKERLGMTPDTWGAPCNKIDENTSRALSELPDFTIWFYGKNDTEKFLLDRKIDIEVPTGIPNYKNFTETYEKDKLDRFDFIVLQIHPNYWDKEAHWENFEKCIDYLLQKNAVFMNPTEYMNAITEHITVTTTADNGPGTLREAINKTNQKPKGNTIITVPPGIYTLEGMPGEDKNLSGDLDIRGNVTIMGAGSGKTIIDGKNNDRIFHIHKGRVNISGVTLTHGKETNGGAIRINGGVLFIKNSTIKENIVTTQEIKAEVGGAGIFCKGAKLTITGCTISDNKGEYNGTSKGGAIRISNFETPAPISIRNCTIENNIANSSENGAGLGGGIFVHGGNPNNEIFIYGNSIKNNIASLKKHGEGGGLFLRKAKAALIQNNRIIANKASNGEDGWGAGIYADDDFNASLINNLIAENYGAKNGTGIYLGADPQATPLKPINASLFNNTIANNYIHTPNLPTTPQNKPLEKNSNSQGIYLGSHVNLTMINNLISGHQYGIFKEEPSIGTVINADTNLFFNTTDSERGTHSIEKNPMLTSDYKLPKASPAVDHGISIPTVTWDMFGTERNQGIRYDIGCFELLSQPEPTVSVTKNNLNFAASGTFLTPGQALWIFNSGSGSIDWKAKTEDNWIKLSTEGQKGPGKLTVSVDPSGLPTGIHTGTVRITGKTSDDSPQTVKILLNVLKPGASTPPKGVFLTPKNEISHVSGSIPLTGWVIDDIAIERVEIYAEPRGEKSSFVGNAVLIEGARPDIEIANPQTPCNSKAGWGYMLLTNLLPNKGNGTFSLHAFAIDKEGNRFALGTRIIHCDNNHAYKPFGTIETPEPGGIASGRNYLIWGWALTPTPNTIPTDGKTIHVLVDGIDLGTPNYNIKRDDIASLFPNYINSSGALGYFTLNTTQFRDGLHTIQWKVTDSKGNMEGIGNRYFWIENPVEPFFQFKSPSQRFYASSLKEKDIAAIPVDKLEPVSVVKGFANDPAVTLSPGSDGTIHINIKELENLEIGFTKECEYIVGYMEIQGHIYPLPPGSNLDRDSGIFRWQPGPGFIGAYPMVFGIKERNGKIFRKNITVEIKSE